MNSVTLKTMMPRGAVVVLLLVSAVASDRMKRQTPWKPILGLCETCKPSDQDIEDMIRKVPNQPGTDQAILQTNQPPQQGQPIFPQQHVSGHVVFPREQGQAVLPGPPTSPDNIIGLNPPLPLEPIPQDSQPIPGQVFPGPPIVQNPVINPQNNAVFNQQQTIISQADPSLNQIPVHPIPGNLPEGLPQQFLIGNPPNVVGGANQLFPGPNPFKPSQQIIEQQQFAQQLEQQNIREQQIFQEQNNLELQRLQEQQIRQEQQRLQEQQIRQEQQRLQEHQIRQEQQRLQGQQAIQDQQRLQEQQILQEQQRRLQEQRLQEHRVNEQRRLEEKRIKEEQRLQLLEQQKLSDKKQLKQKLVNQGENTPAHGIPRIQLPNLPPNLQFHQTVEKVSKDNTVGVKSEIVQHGTKEIKVKPEIIFKNKGEILNQPEKISQLQEFIANQLPDLKPGEKPPKVEVIYLSGNEALAGLANPALLSGSTGQNGGTGFSQIAAIGVTPEQIAALQKNNGASQGGSIVAQGGSIAAQGGSIAAQGGNAVPGNLFNIPGAQAVSADQLSQLGIDINSLPGIPKDQLANVQIVGINSADLQNNPNFQGLQLPGLQGAQTFIQQVNQQQPLKVTKQETDKSDQLAPKVARPEASRFPEVKLTDGAFQKQQVASDIRRHQEPQQPVKQPIHHHHLLQNVGPQSPSAHQLIPDRINSVPFTNHNQIINHILQTLDLGGAEEIKLDTTAKPAVTDSESRSEEIQKQTTQANRDQNEDSEDSAKSTADSRVVTPYFTPKQSTKGLQENKHTFESSRSTPEFHSTTSRPIRRTTVENKKTYLNRVRGSSTVNSISQEADEPITLTPVFSTTTEITTPETTTTSKPTTTPRTFSSFPTFASTSPRPSYPHTNLRVTRKPTVHSSTTSRSFTPVFTSPASTVTIPTEQPTTAASYSPSTAAETTQTARTTDTFWQAQPKVDKSSTSAVEITGKGYNNWEIYNQVRDALNQDKEQHASSLTTFSQKGVKGDEPLQPDTTDWKLNPDTASTPEFSQWVTKSVQKSQPTRAYTTLSRTTPSFTTPDSIVSGSSFSTDTTANTLNFHVSSKLGTFSTHDTQEPVGTSPTPTTTERSAVTRSGPVTYHPASSFRLPQKTPLTAKPTTFFRPTTPPTTTQKTAEDNVSPIEIVVSSPSSTLPETFIGSDEFHVPDGYSKITLPLTYSELEESSDSDLPLAFIGPEDSAAPDGYIKIDLKDLPTDGQELDLSEFQLEEEKAVTKLPLKHRPIKNRVKSKLNRPTTSRTYPIAEESATTQNDASSLFPSFAQAKEKFRPPTPQADSVTESGVKSVFGKRIRPKRKKVDGSRLPATASDESETYELDTDASEHQERILGVSSQSKVSYKTKICFRGTCIDQ